MSIDKSHKKYCIHLVFNSYSMIFLQGETKRILETSHKRMWSFSHRNYWDMYQKIVIQLSALKLSPNINMLSMMARKQKLGFIGAISCAIIKLFNYSAPLQERNGHAFVSRKCFDGLTITRECCWLFSHCSSHAWLQRVWMYPSWLPRNYFAKHIYRRTMAQVKWPKTWSAVGKCQMSIFMRSYHF